MPLDATVIDGVLTIPSVSKDDMGEYICIYHKPKEDGTEERVPSPPSRLDITGDGMISSQFSHTNERVCRTGRVLSSSHTLSHLTLSLLTLTNLSVYPSAVPLYQNVPLGRPFFIECLSPIPATQIEWVRTDGLPIHSFAYIEGNKLVVQVIANLFFNLLF